MMEFGEWLEQNTTEYRGYTILPGSITKGDEVDIMFVCRLGATNEEVFADAKKIIDDLEQKKVS